MKRRIGDLRSSPALGGRRAAEQRLAAIDPARYAAPRNHLDGAVTRLSPYIRHGVLTLAEVREAVFARLGASRTMIRMTRHVMRRVMRRVGRLMMITTMV